jgi:hypothetical protein
MHDASIPYTGNPLYARPSILYRVARMFFGETAASNPDRANDRSRGSVMAERFVEGVLPSDSLRVGA